MNLASDKNGGTLSGFSWVKAVFRKSCCVVKEDKRACMSHNAWILRLFILWLFFCRKESWKIDIVFIGAKGEPTNIFLRLWLLTTLSQWFLSSLGLFSLSQFLPNPSKQVSNLATDLVLKRLWHLQNIRHFLCGTHHVFFAPYRLGLKFLSFIDFFNKPTFLALCVLFILCVISEATFWLHFYFLFILLWDYVTFLVISQINAYLIIFQMFQI